MLGIYFLGVVLFVVGVVVVVVNVALCDFFYFGFKRKIGEGMWKEDGWSYMALWDWNFGYHGCGTYIVCMDLEILLLGIIFRSHELFSTCESFINIALAPDEKC